MATRGKTVRELAGLVGGTLVSEEGHSEVVEDVTHDSRQASPHSLFVAIRGSSADGHQHVGQAVAGGAVAVCVDHPTRSGVAEIVVTDTRRALGPLAASVHGNPSEALDVIGVTGTNGKTTVTHYIDFIASAAGVTTGLIGTVHTSIGGESVPAVRTTPEASDLQRLLAEMRDRGVRLVAAEVSSHALALERVAGTRFAVAAFTNLSQDHLDFHGDMAGYLAAKRRLFEEHQVGTAVINVDDPAGREIAAAFPGPVLAVGGGEDIRFTEVTHGPRGAGFALGTPWGSRQVIAPVIGMFNVANAAMAAGCCLVAGIDLDDVVGGLESLPVVPGRFETVSGDDPIRVIVDYAHTPEGIAKAISAVRETAAGRVIAVLGAGGDRDAEKRPLMGAALATADRAFVTTDNPRSEDPSAVAAAVAGGVAGGVEATIDLDRRRAIHRAVAEAAEGDTVIVLGRGHEPFQEIGGRRRPFDDREVARQALAARRESPDFGPDSGSMQA